MVVMKKSDPELKYLGFVRVIAIKFLLLLSFLYDYAKQSAGSFKSTVVTVESAVVSVFGPVYRKFKGVPDDILAFVDKKVQWAPIVGIVQSMIHKALNLVKSIVSDIPLVGMILQGSEIGHDLLKEAQAAGTNAAFKSALSVFKLWALTEFVKFWYAANKIALFHEMAQVVLPVAAYVAGKYNKVVVYFAANGCAVFSYLPLIPIDEIANTYKMVKATEERLKAVEVN